MLKSVIQPRHRMPCFMLAENNNGDICVSDLNAELVVVVDRSGGVRFRYDGAQSKRRKSFDPRCIVTDSRSQVIVTDVYNDCLHILHQNGSLHRYVCMWSIQTVWVELR